MKKTVKRQTVTLSKNGRYYWVELDASYSEYPVLSRPYRTYGWALRYAKQLVSESGYNFVDLVKA